MRIEWSLFVKSWVSSTKNVLCQLFWRRFLNFVSVFLLFQNFLPLEKSAVLHLYKIEFPSPKDALCQVWLKLAERLKRRFLNFVNVFLLFPNYLPLEKNVALHLTKFESSSPKEALCQVWLRLALLFWRRRFYNFFNAFSLFHNYLPLEKGGVLHLNKL